MARLPVSQSMEPDDSYAVTVEWYDGTWSVHVDAWSKKLKTYEEAKALRDRLMLVEDGILEVNDELDPEVVKAQLARSQPATIKAPRLKETPSVSFAPGGV